MREAENPLLSLTASDLMSRELTTVHADMPLKEAAAELARREIHGAPVVDSQGRCIGVLSVTDLARWASGLGISKERLARTCSFQETCREPGGQETTLCTLAEGVCPMQQLREFTNGTVRLACTEPNSVPVDWQVVQLESLPADAVRDFMTTTVVTTEPDTRVPELARLMLHHPVHRLIVLDAGRRPVGIVTINDLLQVLAHPELSLTDTAR